VAFALAVALSVSGSMIATNDDATAAPPTPLSGLLDDAEIARDVRGIAHITASNDHDLFFLQGWVHAGDRLFQMDVSRRLASGTLAELLGTSVLPSDVQFRTLGLRRVAERSLPLLSSDTRAILHAYADGVNAWVASHALPPEYAALGLTAFDPWAPLDTGTVGKLFAFVQSFGLDIQATLDYASYVRAGLVGGFDGSTLFTEDVFRFASFTDASTVPDAGGFPPVAESRLRGPSSVHIPSSDVLHLARVWTRQLERVPSLRAIADASPEGGSNEWGISGSLSASGLPMLANDPHLDLGVPSTFYPIHLKGDGIDVHGEGFAGAPGVVHGHNRFITWGSTSNPMDVTDAYQEQVVPDPTSPSGLSTVYLGALEHVVAIPEQYRANVGGDVVPVPPSPSVPLVTLIVPRRNQGPIVALDESSGTALSVQWAGFAGTREVEAALALNRARNIDEFQSGLEWFDVGSQNFGYADTAGHIAMFTAGEMPLREDLEAGTVHGLPPWFIRDGTGGNEWLPAATTYPGQALPYEILPPEEMPQLVDPPAGFFVNANNDPVGTTLDNDPLNQLRSTRGIYYLNALNPSYYGGFRAGRITEMLRERIAAEGRISFPEMEAMQADTTLIDAEVFVPHILRAWDRARSSSTPELAALGADPDLAEAVTRLQGWDHTTPTGIPEGYDAADESAQLQPPSSEEIADSVAATIYALWRARVLANTVDATVVTLGLNPPDGLQALVALRRLLERYASDGGVGSSGVDFFQVPGVADPEDQRDVVILTSLQQALDRLASAVFAPAFGGSTDQDHYRWGKLHRIVFEHPLDGPFSVPPAGGAFPQPLPGLVGIPTDGGLEAVDASSHDARAWSLDDFMFGHGPARRFVAEISPSIVRSRWVSSLPGGSSGRIGDPHYVDLLPVWLTNEAYPQFLRRSDLLPTFVSIERFAPQAGGVIDHHRRFAAVR
jgi:penicillin amidase